MSAMTIAISLVAGATGGSAFTSMVGQANGLASALGGLSAAGKKMSPQLLGAGIAAGVTGAAFAGMMDIIKTGVNDASDLQLALLRLEQAAQLNSDAFDTLKAAVVDLNITSLYGAQEVSDAFQQLLEMGFSASQVMYGMGAAESEVTDHAYDAQEALQGVGRQAMAVGEAMQTDAVTGATLLGSVLHTFAHDNLDAAEAANILVGTFYNGVPSAEALQGAVKNAGAMADTAGISFRDFSTILGLLSQAGLPAAEAGTSLRYMIQSLIAPTQKQAAALGELGINTVNTTPMVKNLVAAMKEQGGLAAQAAENYNGTTQALQQLFTQAQKFGDVPLGQTFNQWAANNGLLNSSLYDSNGQFKGLGNAIQVLDQAMSDKGMSMQQKMDIITQLFNVRSGRAAQILTNLDQFKKAYDDEWDSIGKSNALQNAQAVMATFQGAVETLQSTVESVLALAFMPLIEKAAPVLQAINGLAEGFLSLDPKIQGSVGIILLIVTAFLGLSAVILTIVTIVGVLAAVGVSFGAVFGTAAAIIGGLVAVIAAGIGIFALLQTNILSVNGPLGGFIQFILAAWQAVQYLGGSLLSGFMGAMVAVKPILDALGQTVGGIININLTLMGNLLKQVLLPAWENIHNSLVKLQPLWEALGPILAVIGAVIGGIVIFTLVTLISLLAGLISGIATFIGGLVTFISGLVTVIAGIIQIAIVPFQVFFQILDALFHGHTDQIGNILLSGLQSMGDGAKTILGGLLLMVMGLLQGTIGALLAAVGGFVTSIIAFFQNLFDTLVGHSIVPDLVNAILKWISDLVTGVLNFINRLVVQVISAISAWANAIIALALGLESRFLAAIVQMEVNVINTINLMINLAVAAVTAWVGKAASGAQNVANAVKNIISSLPGMATKWGGDMVQNFANGILSGLGWVANAASKIAQKAKDILHFSKPDEGPLADADTYGPDFVKLYAQGITDNVGLVGNAASRLATVAATGVRTPQSITAAGVTGQAGLVVIPINLDGKQMATYTVDLMTRQVRVAGATRYAK